MCAGNVAGTAVATVLIENERARVTEWHFASHGDNTGWHRHAYDYVVVPLFDGALELREPEGVRRRVELQHGVPYFRGLGVEHDVLNGNDFECRFLEVEILQ